MSYLKVIYAFMNKKVVFAKGFRHYSKFRLFSVIHYHHHFPYIMLSTFLYDVLNFPPKYFNKTTFNFNSKKKSTQKHYLVVCAYSQVFKVVSGIYVSK